MKKAASITIIIPAYNEERNLGNAITTINDTVKRFVTDYELIVIDDGSKDRTGIIAEEFAKKTPKVRVVHFKKNRGLGATYKEGIRLATKEYLTMLPGDGGVPGESLVRVLERLGDADVILSYTVNPEVRPLIRRIVSTLFTKTLNILFGLNLKYYNGTLLYKLSLVRQVKITTDSFAFHPEILVQLLGKKNSYIQVPIMVQEREGTTTNIFRIKNMVGVCATIVRLFFRTYFGKAFGKAKSTEER